MNNRIKAVRKMKRSLKRITTMISYSNSLKPLFPKGVIVGKRCIPFMNLKYNVSAREKNIINMNLATRYPHPFCYRYYSWSHGISQ